MALYGTIGADGCPCGEYEDNLVRVDAHCWRTDRCDCECEFSGVHYVRKPGVDPQAASAKAHEIAKYIEKAWATEVKVVKEEPI